MYLINKFSSKILKTYIMKLRLTFLLLILTIGVAQAQTHFTPVGNFTDAMNINILEAKVNGVNLVAGDEVGIFDGNLCVGSFVLIKNLQALGDVDIAASKAGADDAGTGPIDGFKTGNTISFRLYDASEDEEISLVVATFVSPSPGFPSIASPKFEVGSTAFVSLLATHNYKPKAKAGADKEILEGGPGSLDGSASYDFDNKPNSSITYNWDDLDNIGLSATNVVNPSFTAPLVNTDTKYRFALTVNDGEKNSKPDTIVVTVKQINYPPVANAGADFEIPEGDPGQLDASASSDPDGLGYSFSWVIEPAEITLDDVNGAKPNFTAPMVTNDKIYLAILTVTNTVSLSDKDTVKVKVVNYNIKPIARAGADQEVNENVTVTLDGSASSDPDNAPNGYLHFKWTSVEGLTFDNDTLASPKLVTPFYLKDSILRVVLVVNDGGINSNPDTVLVKVKHANLAPVANAGPDQNVNEGVNVTLNGSTSSDADKLPNVTLTYKWTSVQGLTINNSTTVSPVFTTPFYLKDSTLQFILVVNDGAIDSKEDTVLIKVKHANLAPTANAGVDQNVDEGVNVTLDGSASADADKLPNATLTFKWTSLQGLTINNSTTVSPDFTTPFYLKDSTLQFVLVVNDGALDSKGDTVLVKVKHKNLPPTADAGTDFSVNENMLGQLDGSGSSDLDGTITYKWTATGITITGSTLFNPTFTAPEVQADSIVSFILTVTDDKLATDNDTVSVNIKHVNKKPVANAGADQEVDENIVITLDGSKSTDPDLYDVITYKWVAPAGITLDDATSKTPKFTSPTIIEEYINYTFKLIVNDGKLDSDTDRVVVKVIHLNIAPVADAGADISIDENVNGNLDGSKSSDFEGKPLTYSWTAPAAVVISNPAIAQPSFDAPEVQKDTVYIVSLTVNDGVRNSIPDTVKISVKHINKKPVANAGANQEVDENVLVTLDGTGSNDMDKYDVITYLWTSLDGAVLSDNTSATPTFTTPWLLKDSIYDFQLVVNDGTLNSDLSTVSVKVNHANLQPVANAGSDIQINENTAGILNGSGSSDPEGMTLTYAWSAPAGFVIDNPATVSPTFTAPEVDKNTDFEIVLTVNDGKTTNNIDKDTVIVTVYHINKPPVARAGADFSIREQKLATLNGSASYDPDPLDTISFNWVAPAGITLSDPTSPTPSFTAGDVAADTQLSFELTITDKPKVITKSANVVISNAKDTVVVTVTANKAPVANAGINQTVKANEMVTLHGENSSDPDGDVLTYAWTAPAGVTLINPTSANPTFVAPFNDDEVTFSFILEVKDELGLTDSKTVKVTVISNVAPEIRTELLIYVFEGEKVSLDASKTIDPNGDLMYFNWSHFDLTFIPVVELVNSKTPIVSFVAPLVDKQTYMPIALQVTDGSEESYEMVKVYIKDKINNAPVAKAGDDKTINEGDSGKLDGSASGDVDGNIITYLWKSNYLVFDDVTAVKPGFKAPEVVADTTVLVTLTVNDGKLNSLPDTVKLTIKNVNKMPIANAGADFVINEGVSGKLDGSASSDADGNPITYLWNSGYLVLDNATSVKPSFKAPEVGKDTTVLATLVVNDGKLNSKPDTVKITVKHVNKIPVANAGLDITVNEGDNITLNGSASKDPDGDVITYTWSALGLSITGSNLAMASAKAPEVQKEMKVPVVLVVNDGKANSLPDTTWVTIKQVNKAPVWAQVPVDVAFIGYEYSSEIKVTDPDLLDKISITSTDLPSWLILTDKGNGTATLATDSIPRQTSLLGKHTYAIKATDGTVIINATVELTITIKTGIADLTLSAVKFYPNPTNGLVNVEFNSLPEMGTTIQVFNQLGQSVMIRKADAQTNQLNLSTSPSGLYYIKVITEKAYRTEKIILRKDYF